MPDDLGNFDLLWEQYYKLDGTEVVSCSREEWEEFWADFDKRRVALSYLGGIEISTVFLGINHAMRPGERAQFFETRVSWGSGDELDMMRYATWDEAVAGHERAIRRLPDYQRSIEEYERSRLETDGGNDDD